MQDSQLKPEQLDELIMLSYERLKELHKDMVRAATPRQRSRLYDAMSKMTAAFVKLLKARGVEFAPVGEGESLAELLSRLAKEDEKKVEETIKDLVAELGQKIV